MTSRLPIAIPAPPAVLNTQTVALRPISPWDIPEILIAHQDDPELAAALGFDRPPTAAELGREIDTAATEWAAGTLKLTVLTPGADGCRGRLVIDTFDPAAGSTRAAVWIAPGWRGRGLAGAAVAVAGEWLSRISDVRQLRWRTTTLLTGRRSGE